MSIPNRREFLKTCGTGLTALSLLPPDVPSGLQPRPPASLRIEKPTLTAGDFEYLGLFKVPADANGQNLGYSTGAFTGRRVNGDLRFFLTGSTLRNDPVFEISYPGYGDTIETAPRASLIKNWGDIYQGKKLTYRNTEKITRGLLWHENRLWWSYGDIYNASSSSWDPSVGCTILNDAAGSSASYGPWRTQEHSQRTRGYMLELPDWFATANTAGNRLGIGAPMTSGNAQSPWGAMLASIPTISPGTAADPLQSTGYHGNERWSIACKRLILHDINHPQARDANYRRCGWQVLYDCGAGVSLQNGSPQFTDCDMISSAIWIDAPNKQGLVFFGQLATKLEGFSYTNDTLPHIWYGPDTCCHGQNGRPVWQATGPGTPTAVPHAWIYGANDIAKVAAGSTAPWGLTPSSLFTVHTLSSPRGLTPVSKSVPFYYFGGSHYDQQSGLLFVTCTQEDWITSQYEGRPVVRVFRIKP